MTATVMLLGSTAVFAADAISGTVASVSVTKTVTVAEGITVPATTFTIEAVQVANAADEPAPPVAPTGVKATVGTLEVASGASGQTGTPTLNFVPLTPRAGEYTFMVTEKGDNAVTAGEDGWQPNSQEYKIVVLVKNGASGLERQYAVYNAGGAKVNSVDFTNTYLDTAGLTVKKNITNPGYANVVDDEFEMLITFTKASTAAGNTVTAKVNGVDTTFTYGTETALTVKLKHGESLQITGLPAGTKYTVRDENTGNYTYAGTDYVSNGGASTTAAPAVVGGDGTNEATVNNTFKDITITGIVTTYLPYIAMILLALAALALYVISRRRRAARY